MSADGALDQIRAALATHPAVSAVTLNESNKFINVTARSPSAEWEMTVTPHPRGGLPIIGVPRHSLIGSLAHVSHDGTVCVSDNEGLSIDVTRPGGVAEAALTDALVVLEKSIHDYNAGYLTDLNDELEGYWESLPNATRADIHLELDEKTRKIQAFVGAGKACVAFSEPVQLKRPKYAPLLRLKQRADLAATDAIYIALRSPVQPPSPTMPLSTAKIQKWLGQAQHPERVQQLLKSWPRHCSEAYLVFSQPRSQGLSAFGVQFSGRGGRHPLLEPSGWTARPLALTRHGASHLRARGGAAGLPRKTHVVVIGCGSIGSRIAEQLAQSGVGKLTLVDRDVFTAENIYRHVLGGESCGCSKVSALKVQLQLRFPQIDVEAVPLELAQWTTESNLKPVDGIVVAIGKPHVERDFIKTLWSQSAANFPIVTSWLEPLGIGGHSQLTIPGRAGCLECLYTTSDGGSHLIPKTGYTKPDQKISRNLTGCVGAFTPYSALDATQTALLATRQLMAALLGESVSSYVAWRGSDRDFKKAGLEATDWYGISGAGHGLDAAVEYSRVMCPVCGGSL